MPIASAKRYDAKQSEDDDVFLGHYLPPPTPLAPNRIKIVIRFFISFYTILIGRFFKVTNQKQHTN